MTKSLMATIALCSALTVQAQDKSGNWYFGLSEGMHVNSMRFSDVKDRAYGSKSSLASPVISVFAQGEFGDKHQYAVRPEIAYLRRGGKLNDFKLSDGDKADYSIRAHYIDLRLSFIYNFLADNSTFRPYVFVAPRLGFVTGGEIKMESEEGDARYGVACDVTDANMAGTYFAVAPGVGARWNFHLGRQGQHKCWFGVEASYEFGLSDTYSSKEKDRKSFDLLGNAGYKVDGTRKFSGFEIKAIVGIPFSVFSKSKAVAPAPVATPEPVVVKRVEKERPCYTLEEIIDMMAKNENVAGKTICAVDAINFDFNKSVIKPESYGYLNKLAETLKRINARIQVKGHTDSVGSDEVNMNLSRERAQSVVNYLLNKGVNRSRLSYDYYGASRPLTTNDTEEGRAMNRRVEIEIMK